MKKTTSSLFAASAALGIIAASAGVAFAAETPIGDPVKDNPSVSQPTPAPSVPASQEPTPGGSTPGGSTPGGSTPGGETPSDETPGGSTPGGSTPGAEVPSTDQPDTSAPGAEPGTGSNGVAGSRVSARGQVSPGNGLSPVSARRGIQGVGAPAEGSAAANSTLANTGFSSLAAGAGVIALAGGVTLVIARKRH
ncbi:MAG: peptidase [Actinomyces bouchesdurhonensis]|uniref:Peptidase n=1 Tax=Actinomyces bouchesdurhonensis TaxID=1852361 RepID=A0A929WW45_9ACTO|nr:peptidase [Actinomyces bouchesdurhonensis]